MTYLNVRRRLELLLLFAFLLLAFAAGDTWLAWVSFDTRAARRGCEGRGRGEQNTGAPAPPRGRGGARKQLEMERLTHAACPAPAG